MRGGRAVGKSHLYSLPIANTFESDVWPTHTYRLLSFSVVDLEGQ